MCRNADYISVLESISLDIAKGRVGLCGAMTICIDIKGSEHDFRRCINKLQRAFEAGKEKFKLSTLASGSQLQALFTSQRFNIEVRNS